jgi:hypothetical protein
MKAWSEYSVNMVYELFSQFVCLSSEMWFNPSMTSLSTPLHITVLIHCHVAATTHPQYDAPAVQKALDELLNEGAIFHHEEDPTYCFRTTEKGCAWIQSLCSVPPPVQCWKDGATGELIKM